MCIFPPLGHDKKAKRSSPRTHWGNTLEPRTRWVYGCIGAWILHLNPMGLPYPMGSGCVAAGLTGALILGAGGGWGWGGPKGPGVRLRRHHKTRENFFKYKNPMGPLTPRTPTLHTIRMQCYTTRTMNQADSQFVGTVVTGETPLPNWLSVPDPKPPRPTKAAKELLHIEYEQIFERVIEDVYRGRSLQSLIQDDFRLISYEDFLRWVKRDPTRHERFKEAQEMRTEFLAGEILEIADGVEAVDPASNDTVNRDKLRIDTRKWLMSAHNKKRYGEVKQVELGGTISITEALAAAQARVIEAEVLDVTPRLTDGEND